MSEVAEVAGIEEVAELVEVAEWVGEGCLSLSISTPLMSVSLSLLSMEISLGYPVGFDNIFSYFINPTPNQFRLLIFCFYP